MLGMTEAALARNRAMRTVWVLALVFVLAGWALAAQASEPTPLTTTEAVRALSHADAARHLPVDIQATVTFFRGFERSLFIQGGDTGIYVFVTTALPLQPGDVVRVRGTTSDSFNPTITSSDVTLLRHGPLPEPVRVGWPELIRADYDCRWVKVEGKITLAERGLSGDHSLTDLVLDMDGGRADIRIDGGDRAQFDSLLDTQVEMTAVAGEDFDGKMEQTGVRLNVPSMAYLRILKRPPVNPWSIPVTPMDKVLREYNFKDDTPRVRVEGMLTFYLESNLAVLQDGDKSIRVLTTQSDHLNLNDKVEAIGIPFVQDGLLTLRQGEIRSEGPGTPVTPQPVTWDEMTSGKYAFNLVSIEGTVVTEMREQSRDVYVISVNNYLFSAWLPRPPASATSEVRPPMREIPLGTKVRVSGVAALENGNPYNGPIAFSILLPFEGAIATVASPPWLDVRHLTEIVGILLLVIFAVSVRAWLIEKGARRKIAGMAYLEQRRAKILELINSSQPLAETLQQITELASASLGGAACWCQVADGAKLGNFPLQLDKGSLRVVQHTIPSRVGGTLGTVFAAFDPNAKPHPSERTVLDLAAGLATLAIDTSRFYSDLVHRSEFDLLTDVQNRFSLEKHLEQQIRDAHRSARIFGLLYVDLDHFKRVNDEYGHHVGDMYLQEAARRMKQQLRPEDMLSRLGGDEFAALAPHVRSRADAEEIARRLERCFAEPFCLQEHVLRGTVSVGIAMYPEDGSSKDALLTAADVAMYKAKHARREAAEPTAADNKITSRSV
jgi:diguanylate cyclase (GGDEF)-like protein